MKQRLLITETDGCSDEDLNSLGQFFEVHLREPRTQAEITTAIREIQPEILLVGLGFVIGKKEAEASKALRVIASPTTGSDHLDLELLKQLNIQVVTLRTIGANIEVVSSTAELAWA